MIYTRQTRVEFNNCEPAGIVFYPRYFEMTNSICENFFREVVGFSYAAMMADVFGVPTARLESDFRAPSRLDDLLDWTLVTERPGASSATLRLEARCCGQHRLIELKTLAWLSAEHRPARWPDPIRAVMAAHLEDA